MVGQKKGGWGRRVPSLLLYLDRFSGLICRWAVSGAALPQATQQQILVADGLPAAQGRHEAAQATGEHQRTGTAHHAHHQISSGAGIARLLRPLMDEGHEKQSAAQQKHPRIDQRGGQSRQQNGKSRIPWVQSPAAQARRCAAGNALAQYRHKAPPGSAARKRPASPDRSTTAPNTNPSQQPMPQPYRAAPSTMGIRTSETKIGRNGWRCPQAGASQQWRQGVRLLRYTVWFFP